MQLQEFKDQYLNLLLTFLWEQWSALGVAGYNEADNSLVIDPEALLLLSLAIARYDQRLFDEILDWLLINERFINVQRLRNILEKESFSSAKVLSAVAAFTGKNKAGLKWKGLSGSYKKPEENVYENLFYLKSGSPLPVPGEKDSLFYNYGFIRNPVECRKLSAVFPAGRKSSLLLQLRALFGLSSRCEAILYLLINGKGTIQEVADQSYYAWRSIQDVLFEIGQSGVLSFPAAKKGRVYYMKNDSWFDFLLGDKNSYIKWICWPPLFRAFEIIQEILNRPGFLELSALKQAADFRSIMTDELIPRYVKAGLGSYVVDYYSITGEEYPEYFIKTNLAIINGILAGNP